MTHPLPSSLQLPTSRSGPTNPISPGPGSLSRRSLLAAVPLAAAAPAAAQRRRGRGPFLFCLNTSTLRGQNLGIETLVDIAAEAGYDGIEPWINELDRYIQRGLLLRDLRKRIEDRGLRVFSAIGFAEWIVDDPARRARGLEEARRTMEMVAQIGGTHIAAPPSGAVSERVDPRRAGERYRALLELGEKIGVIPQAEVWGFSQTLGRLSETAAAALESGHPRACILADVYHLHRGGSGFAGLRLLNGAAMHAFHVNDYPAEPPAGQLTDAHRVYPGDGVAPLAALLRDLHAAGFRGALSLELFNRDYWQQDAKLVARTGIEKMRAMVRTARISD